MYFNTLDHLRQQMYGCFERSRDAAAGKFLLDILVELFYNGHVSKLGDYIRRVIPAVVRQANQDRMRAAI